MLLIPTKKKYPYQNLSMANLPRETWRDLPFFEDLYQVSSHGRTKSLPRLLKCQAPAAGPWVLIGLKRGSGKFICTGDGIHL
jgi:hypothetical protein